MRRFLALAVRKIISSMVSFSGICHWVSFPGPKEFFQHRGVAGILGWASKLLRMKLKRALR